MDKLSALMDGELGEFEARGELSRLKERPELQEQWGAYHLIGDAMRGDRMLSKDFGRRLSERLAAEPTVLAPRQRPAKKFVTYALSAAASLSAVAMVAWVALSGSNLAPVATPQIAKAPVAAPAARALPQAVTAPSDGRLNEYFLAHQGFSPSTAIQGVTPYIRSVAARHPAKSR